MQSSEVTSPGRRLAVVRNQLGLSQKEAAERLGIPMRTYQSYEREDRDLPSHLAVAAYTEFGVRPLWLLAGIEQEPPADVRWTAEMLRSVESAATNLTAILVRSRVKLEPVVTGRLIAHLAQYGITEDEKIIEALRLAGITTGRKQK